MQWLSITIQTTSVGITPLSECLTALGFDSFVVNDSAQFEQFLADNTAYWDYVDETLAQKMANVSEITLYLEQSAAVPEQLALLRGELEALRQRRRDVDFGALTLRAEEVADEDWENSWKQNYQPVPVGKRLLVTPCWLHPDNPERRLPVVLDPGMIFGTGTHETTQLCMRALENLISGGERVIDLGSGSGILSITALLLGAGTATGVDIDPKAEDIARENAALNQIGSERFTACTCNVLSDRAAMAALAKGGYDVVCANIVADVIVALAAVVPEFLRPEGVFLCSGILSAREGDVIDALRCAGLQVTHREQQNGWCMLCAKRSKGRCSPCAQ